MVVFHVVRLGAPPQQDGGVGIRVPAAPATGPALSTPEVGEVSAARDNCPDCVTRERDEEEPPGR